MKKVFGQRCFVRILLGNWAESCHVKGCLRFSSRSGEDYLGAVQLCHALHGTRRTYFLIKSSGHVPSDSLSPSTRLADFVRDTRAYPHRPSKERRRISYPVRQQIRLPSWQAECKYALVARTRRGASPAVRIGSRLIPNTRPEAKGLLDQPACRGLRRSPISVENSRASAALANRRPWSSPSREHVREGAVRAVLGIG